MYNTITHKLMVLLWYNNLTWHAILHGITFQHTVNLTVTTVTPWHFLITTFIENYIALIYSQAWHYLCCFQADNIIWTYWKCQIEIMCFAEACLLLHADQTALLARRFFSSIQRHPLFSSTTCQTRFFNQHCNSTLQFSDLFFWSKVKPIKTLKN